MGVGRCHLGSQWGQGHHCLRGPGHTLQLACVPGSLLSRLPAPPASGVPPLTPASSLGSCPSSIRLLRSVTCCRLQCQLHGGRWFVGLLRCWSPNAEQNMLNGYMLDTLT